jgi:hypothetical protein
MQSQDNGTLLIGAAAAGAFGAAMLWNSAALLPLSIILAAAIIARPALNVWREHLRVRRAKLEAVASLDHLQSRLIEDSDSLSSANGELLVQISTTLEELKR